MDNGNIPRRNQRHIRKVHNINARQAQQIEEVEGEAQSVGSDIDSDTTIFAGSDTDTDSDSAIPYHEENNTDSNATIPYMASNSKQTRSGRVIKKKLQLTMMIYKT